MTEKQQNALNTIIAALPEDLQKSYLEVAEYAISLGYMPTLKGARKDYAEFINAKLDKKILKINTAPAHRGISIKFFAMRQYDGIFLQAVNERLIYWSKLGHPARCFACGTCDGTEGYTVTLPSGDEGFLCGFGLVEIASFSPQNVRQVKDALLLQHRYNMDKSTT